MTRRQAALLAEIIKEYIEAAEPVSSRLLSNTGFFGLSSASIRAEMNHLEQLGYLVHRHTSGGRVPTAKGYRYFVNAFLDDTPLALSIETKRRINSALEQAGANPRQLNRALAQVLSELSEQAVITSLDQPLDCYKTGLASLFGYPEFQELGHISRIAQFFDHFEHFFSQIEREIQAEYDQISIFIGRENPINAVDEDTLIMAKYRLPAGNSGSVTLVGPMRMDYAKNIGLIRYAQQQLNQLADYYG